MNFEFKLGDNKIDICDDFKYLGIVFTKHRAFFKAIKHNVDHTKKVLHLLYKRINNLQIFSFTYLIVQSFQFCYMVVKRDGFIQETC